MPTVKASVRLGFSVLSEVSDEAYYLSSLTESQQSAFKANLEAAMENSSNGITPSHRATWEDFDQDADANEHVTEGDVQAVLNQRLGDAKRSGVEFRISYSRREVRYLYYNGKRHCFHVYPVERKLGAAAWEDWTYQQTYGSSTVRVLIQVGLIWGGGY